MYSQIPTGDVRCATKDIGPIQLPTIRSRCISESKEVKGSSLYLVLVISGKEGTIVWGREEVPTNPFTMV